MERITTYKLPRKLKVSFSNGSSDTAHCTIQDLGFLAVRKDGKDYFRVYLGGGLGRNPKVALLYPELIEPSEVLNYVEAMVRLFKAEGNYENKAKARIRYIVDKLGEEGFISEYKKYVDEISPKPKYLKNYTLAFIVGGIICVIGQIINDLYSKVGNLDKIPASTATSITLIFIGAFLTGLGVYDLIGKRAGAGSIIPITGFANSIVSPAMEYKREGFVLGVGANLFKIAGPVLVYGIGSSIICGFIYYIFTLIK